MRYYEEVLAQAARNYAFTGDKKWEQRYRLLEPESNKLLKKAVEKSSKKDKEFFSTMNNANHTLVEMEIRSLDFVSNDQASKAIELLESNEYEKQRKVLRDGLAEKLKTIEYGHPELAQSTDTMVDYVKTITELEGKLSQSEANVDVAKQEIEKQKMKRMSVVGELSARLAHDLRNPLSVIKNVLHIMELKNLFPDETSREYLTKIDRAIIRMTHQIDEVLDYVSPKPLNLEKISLLKTLIMAKERLQIPENIIVNISQNDVVFIHDQEKLEIVFVNLMTNAIQEMEQSGGRLDVRIIETEHEVRLEFEDTGRGISPDVLEKIFEPLFTTKQTGTGLGLVSCKSIIEKHNGQIEVQSTINRGTVFIIRLQKLHDNPTLMMK